MCVCVCVCVCLCVHVLVCVCASIAFVIDPQRFVMSYSHSPLGLFAYITQCLEPLNSEKQNPVPTPGAFFSIKRKFFAQHEEPTPAPPRMSLLTVHLTNATPVLLQCSHPRASFHVRRFPGTRPTHTHLQRQQQPSLDQ